MNVIQIEPALYERFKAISVTESQSKFVFSVGQVLDELDPKHSIPYGIEEEGVPVGFFILDWVDAPQSVTLKSFQIDRQAQGKGYAKQALEVIKELVRGVASELRLTVNCENQAAYHLYKTAGFVTLPELYLGGPAGPQYVMVYALRTG